MAILTLIIGFIGAGLIAVSFILTNPFIMLVGVVLASIALIWDDPKGGKVL